MNFLPASSFRELSGKGTISKHLITSKMFLRDHLAGFQSRFKVLTQISPEGTATLGWKILVKKLAFGALWGKPLSMTILHLNTPPW
jgi:hypothetical protein